YNPVRILGLIGLVAVAMASVIGLTVIALRLQGVTTLGPWGVASLYAALLLAVGGVSIFSLGATFNYLVSLFHRRPIRQGLFRRPFFNTPLDRHFGWMGVLLGLGGLLLAAGSVTLSFWG